MNWLRKECEPYRDMISALLDGELSENEKIRLQNHLAHCDDCSALCVAFAAADGVVSAGMVPVPRSLHTDIMKQVKAHASAHRRQRVWRVARPVLAVAACAVIVAGIAMAVVPGFHLSGGSDLAEQGKGTASAMSAAMAEPENGETEQSSLLDQEDTAEDTDVETSEVVFATDTAENQNAAASVAAAPAPVPAPAPDLSPAAGAGKAYGESASDYDRAMEVPEEAPSAEMEANVPQMSVEVEVAAAPGEDGSFQGIIISDSSGLLSPGITVTIQPDMDAQRDEAAQEETSQRADGEAGTELRPGERVTIRFHALQVVPEGWLIRADTVERQ